jgi:hypothetical protein
MRETLAVFTSAAAGKRGEEALAAMGKAYMELLAADPRRLMLQLHMYAACDDPQIREVARRGYRELVEFTERASGASRARVARFFAKGMLINVIAAMGLAESTAGWAQRLLHGCREED